MMRPPLIELTLRQAYSAGVRDPDDPLLPEVTEDEAGGFASLDDDLLENVPPHHN